MPIEITAPDGGIVEFPDGMTDDAIAEAMGRHYGGPEKAAAPPGTDPSSWSEAGAVFGNEAANAASLNLWRNAQAGYDAYANNKPFDKAYADQKALDEARFAAHPTAGYSGIAAGLVAPALIPGVAAAGAVPLAKGAMRLMPAIEGVAPAAGRALKAGAYGAGYGGVSEFADSKDPSKALTSAVNGAMLAAAANPILEKVGSKALNYINRDATKDIGQTRADKMMTDVIGAKEANGAPLTDRWIKPTFSETTGEVNPGQITPSEAELYKQFIKGMAEVGHNSAKSLPWIMGMASGGLGAYHGGLGGGALGTVGGALTGGATEWLGHVLTNKATDFGDRLVSKAVERTREMYKQPVARPYTMQAPGHVGLLGGTVASEAASDPLTIRVKPNNR